MTPKQFYAKKPKVYLQKTYTICLTQMETVSNSTLLTFKWSIYLTLLMYAQPSIIFPITFNVKCIF